MYKVYSVFDKDKVIKGEEEIEIGGAEKISSEKVKGIMDFFSVKKK